jgi:predicted SprT family Zn-dependent metalloprotease
VSSKPDIVQMFNDFNEEYFNGEIPDIPVFWSPFMRVTAGFASCITTGGIDRFGRRNIRPTRIRLAEKLFKKNGWNPKEVELTLIHEMVHCYLYHKHNFLGHGGLFQSEMDRIVGYRESHTCHSYDVTGLRNEKRVVFTCEYCGEIHRRSRMPKAGTTYTHSGCGGKVTYEKLASKRGGRKVFGKYSAKKAGRKVFGG